MLAAAFHHLATPAPLALRRLGYVGQSVALWSRSRRCRQAWAPHLAATRAVVAEAVAGVLARGSPPAEAVVLGSGLLDDVPLDHLATSFARVTLVDAVHPWPARLAARRRTNVRLVTADLSGATARLAGAAGPLRPPLASLCARADLVVSANLLSQLPIVPVRTLARRRGDAAADALGAEIVAAHLAALAGLDARICLVTDVESIEEDRAGRVLAREDLLHGQGSPGRSDRAWWWDLAPFGEVARDRRLRHRVLAYPDWRRPSAGQADTTAVMP